MTIPPRLIFRPLFLHIDSTNAKKCLVLGKEASERQDFQETDYMMKRLLQANHALQQFEVTPRTYSSSATFAPRLCEEVLRFTELLKQNCIRRQRDVSNLFVCKELPEQMWLNGSTNKNSAQCLL